MNDHADIRESLGRSQPLETGVALLELRVSMRVLGGLLIPSGVVFLLAAVTVEGARSALFGALFAALFAVVGSWGNVRDNRKRIEKASSALDGRVISHSSRVLKTVLWGAVLEVAFVLIALAWNRWLSLGAPWRGFGFDGGLQLGLGASSLVSATSIARWERAHGQAVLYQERFALGGRRYLLR